MLSILTGLGKGRGLLNDQSEVIPFFSSSQGGDQISLAINPVEQLKIGHPNPNIRLSLERNRPFKPPLSIL